MNEIAAFVEARLAEDEQLAGDAAEAWPDGGVWTYEKTPGGDHKVINGGGYSVLGHYDIDSAPWATGPHVARHDPARAMREVVAKRALVAEVAGWTHLDVDEGGEHSCATVTVIEALQGSCNCGLVVRQRRFLAPIAAVWAEHPDYRGEWAA